MTSPLHCRLAWLPCIILFLAGCSRPGAIAGNTGASTRSAQSVMSQEVMPDAEILGQDAEGCTWVESRAMILFGDHDTKHQARAQAVSEARVKAMQRLLGVRLQHNFIDFQQESSLKGEVTLTDHLLRVTQLGRVLKEEILSAGPVDVPGCAGCRFEAHIRACIVPLRDMTDRDFAVQLSLNRPRFRDGDEAVMAVTCTRDAYVYLFNVDTNWNATLIFPNTYVSDNRIVAGQAFLYPDESLRAKGVHSVARLPSASTISAEMIRVIAVKTPLPNSLLATGPHGSSFLGLMRRLTSTELEWVEDAQAFTIQEH